jgi:hypothetical protein
MTQQETETEYKNIDYTNTSVYRTVKAFQKEGITWVKGEAPPGMQGGIPEKDFTLLKRLRKLDSIIKPDKGPITREITHMHRSIVRQPSQDPKQKGRFIPTECLTITGYFKGYDFAGEQVGQQFTEDVSKKPVMGKIYRGSMRFNPETGEDLGKIDVQKIVDNYYYELPKEQKQREKYIKSIIDNAPGTYPENIHYYYIDTEAGLRDSTFSYEQFTSLNIDQLRELSKRGAGAKGPGYYRDKDNNLRDKDGNIVQSDRVVI